MGHFKPHKFNWSDTFVNSQVMCNSHEACSVVYMLVSGNAYSRNAGSSASIYNCWFDVMMWEWINPSRSYIHDYILGWASTICWSRSCPNPDQKWDIPPVKCRKTSSIHTVYIHSYTHWYCINLDWSCKAPMSWDCQMPDWRTLSKLLSHLLQILFRYLCVLISDWNLDLVKHVLMGHRALDWVLTFLLCVVTKILLGEDLSNWNRTNLLGLNNWISSGLTAAESIGCPSSYSQVNSSPRFFEKKENKQMNHVWNLFWV